MPEVLALRGRSALSPFRVAKLLAAFAALRPGHPVTGLCAHYWHFIEVARALAPGERTTLERLLTYGPADAADGGAHCPELLVLPRFGTISPWSSKATDIAHNCGLDAITRIERGVAFDVAAQQGAGLDDDDRAALLPLIHDRMTQTVVANVDAAQKLFTHVAPRPLATIPLHERGRAALEEADAALGLALSGDEID